MRQTRSILMASGFVISQWNLCRGGTLSAYIDKEIRISIDSAIDIQKDICLGLARLHKENPSLVHRDVKPQNVMLRRTETGIIAKVSDFGLAKHVDPKTRMTEAAGTLAYLPPEGFWDYETPASDVFSAGIIFYIMLTGVPPFKMPRGGYQSTKKSEFQAAIKASRNKRPEPPSKFNSDLTDEINDVTLKALEPDIKQRYKDASEFYSEIDKYQKKKFGSLDEDVKKALEMGKQYGFLGEAVKLIEGAIARYPKQKQEELKQKYQQIIVNWKKGIMM